jgi:TonB family protein
MPPSQLKEDPRIQLPRPFYDHPLQQPLQSQESKQRGEQGIVGLLMFVDATGKISRTSVAKSAGHKALDDAALAIVPNWQLQPGSVEGIPTGMWTCFSVTFDPAGASYQMTPKDEEDMQAYTEVCDEARLKLPPPMS